MGNGRVINAEPDHSLRRVYSFGSKDFVSYLLSRNGHLNLGDSTQTQQNLPEKPSNYGLTNLEPEEEKEDELTNLERKLSERDDLDILIEAANTRDKYSYNGNSYEVYDNGPEYSRVDFKTKIGITVGHIDGILQDVDTGELRYFIAVDKVDSNDGPVEAKETIRPGDKVEYSSKYRGVCEVLLYREVGGTKEVAKFNDKESIVVRYVEVTKIIERAKP